MDDYNDIDAIMRKIQVEVRSRTGDGAAISEFISPAWTRSGPPPPAFGPGEGAQVTLERLLAFRDVEFIYAAYCHILHRDPDPTGFAYYLGSLRSGSLTRLEILVCLRFSEEGRQVGVLI